MASEYMRGRGPDSSCNYSSTQRVLTQEVYHWPIPNYDRYVYHWHTSKYDRYVYSTDWTIKAGTIEIISLLIDG